jgi:hypothetical protein
MTNAQVVHVQFVNSQQNVSISHGGILEGKG